MAGERQQMPVLLEQDGLVTALEQVPGAPVAPAEPLRIAHVEAAHAAPQIGLGGLHQQVVMVLDKAVAVAQPALLRHLAAQQVEKRLRVRDVREQGLAAIAARRHVIARAWILDAKRPGHGAESTRITMVN